MRSYEEKLILPQEPVELCSYLHVHEDLVKKVQESIPDEEDLYSLADFFKIFADSTRIRILYVLLCSETCVCDIAQLLGMTQPAISHQLRILKQSKLVKSTRDGKSVIYSLQDGYVREVMETGLAHLGESL